MTAKRTAPQCVDRPVVAMCAGKDCRKRCEFAKVRDELASECEVVQVKCVGICNGPVVVAHLTDDQPLVFAKLRSKRVRRELVDVVVSNRRPSRDLKSRSVSGSKGKATVKKVRKRLDAA